MCIRDSSGTVGFIISTCLITAFGEVIPQAYGSRHGLEFGAKTTSIVKVIMAILYIICKPVSMILDYALGDELGNVYNRYQLYTMFELYKEHSDFKKDTISTCLLYTSYRIVRSWCYNKRFLYRL